MTTDFDSLRHAATGFTCSALGIISTYPAESLTRQFHVTDGKTVNTRVLVKKMASRGIQGFYKGLGPALITQPSFWAVYMPTYEAFKRVSKPIIGDSKASTMAMAWTAGAVGALTTNPVWVIRQRMQTEIVKGKQNTYRSLVKEMWREAGLKTFFRGGGITMVKNIQMALLLPLFEGWKKQAEVGKGLWCSLGFGTAAAIGLSAATAKIVSSTPVYPLDVLRTNMRFLEGKNVTLTSTAKTLLGRTGGVKNLFRGIGWYWTASAGTFAMMMSLRPYVDNVFKKTKWINKKH